MSELLSEVVLQLMSEAVARHLGLNFPRERWDDLKRALTKATSELGFKNPESLSRWLLEPALTHTRIEELSDFLTVGETHFFRDERLFQLLEHQLIPELTSSSRQRGRGLRIWCAGCATGEEPYSLAIVISRLRNSSDSRDTTILGTDINRRFLQKAEKGVYSQWSFRTVPPGIQEHYFSQGSHGYEIVPEIKRMVQFAHLNLVKDPFPIFYEDNPGIDVIFCRNVLMYFTQESQREVLSKFCECLVAGGFLVVSPAEACLVEGPEFVSVSRPGVILFQKRSKVEATSKGVLPAPPVPHLKMAPKAALTLTFPSSEAVDSPPTEAQPIVRSIKTSLPRNQPQEGGDPFLEARALYHQGLYLEAAEKLSAILAQGDLETEVICPAMFLLSRIYANLGKLDEALEWSQKTVELDKINPRIHYLHGTILQEQGKLEEAAASMARAIFLDPNFVVAHFALGNLFRQMGRFQDSDRHFKTAESILGQFEEDSTVPGSEGMTAAKLIEVIQAMTAKEALNAR